MARPNLGKLLASKTPKLGNSTPSTPARTRFAPSPTGTIHLGSLRTALYNYLLAKSTNGKFFVRLEDTDRSRLKKGAEQNIYDSLKWTSILSDEPVVKQSERKPIYSQFAETLLAENHAYRCFCSKERLDTLAESARQLRPPSTASYDRKCIHLTKEESDLRAKTEKYVIRFKAPVKWPKFYDALHGTVDSQNQVNLSDVRYDDFVILKSDGMPTYHLANVVDDSLMEITHVVRGEEWMPSSPKHVALYNALNKRPPTFVHIPLLTGQGGKKLSKRKSDLGILELENAPEFILPEALVNFVALLGWSPHNQKQGQRNNEVMDLAELEKLFSLQGLTRGNIQVDMGKLQYLNKKHFERLKQTSFEEVVKLCHRAVPRFSLEETNHFVTVLRSHVSCVRDYVDHIDTVFSNFKASADSETLPIVEKALELIKKDNWNPKETVNTVVGQYSKRANMVLRSALLGGKPGTSIVEAMEILGPKMTIERLLAYKDCT